MAHVPTEPDTVAVVVTTSVITGLAGSVVVAVNVHTTLPPLGITVAEEKFTVRFSVIIPK